MYNNGKEYELFVARLQQALLHADQITTQSTVTVERNKKIVDNCGIEREFDIFWEYELGGLTYKTVIECKDYSSPITVEKIDALVGKIRDIPDLKAVFATKTGYQSGALTKAKQNRIELLVVREQNHGDWFDVDGTPLIKKIVCNLHAILSPEMLDGIVFGLNGKWLEENPKIDVSQINLSGLNNEVFIDDIQREEKYSLHQFAQRLEPMDGLQYGEFSKKVCFENAFVCRDDWRLKLSMLEFRYVIRKPIISSFEIDFAKELLGVIEYLQKDTKKSIFRNGVVQTNTIRKLG